MIVRREIDGPDGTVYMIRWELLSLFGWSLKLHRFTAPDWTRALHDHPWPFWSLMFCGSYLERTPRGIWWRRAPCLLVRRATWRHRVERVSKPCWTLVLSGPKVREWGFWPEGVFVPWMDWLRAHGWRGEAA